MYSDDTICENAVAVNLFVVAVCSETFHFKCSCNPEIVFSKFDSVTFHALSFLASYCSKKTTLCSILRLTISVWMFSSKCHFSSCKILLCLISEATCLRSSSTVSSFSCLLIDQFPIFSTGFVYDWSEF